MTQQQHDHESENHGGAKDKTADTPARLPGYSDALRAAGVFDTHEPFPIARPRAPRPTNGKLDGQLDETGAG